MEKTYKCRNGHKFKRSEGKNVTCPTCNEPAELVQWKTVGDFDSSRQGPGIKDGVGTVVNVIKEGIKKPFN